MKVVWRRSIRSTLGLCNSLREAIGVPIERRVLRRTAGTVDLFDGGGHASKAALDFALYALVCAVGGGAQQFIQPTDLRGKNPHRGFESVLRYVVEIRGNGVFLDRCRYLRAGSDERHDDTQGND